MTPHEVGRLAICHPRTVLKAIKKGELEAVKKPNPLGRIMASNRARNRKTPPREFWFIEPDIGRAWAERYKSGPDA